MFRNQHITSCSLLVVEVHLFLPIFTNYSVTTKGPWLEQYSCPFSNLVPRVFSLGKDPGNEVGPFSWLVELVNKANCYTLWAGQMNQILSCDWLPERARWSPILPSRDCSQYPAKKFPRILYWSSSLGLRWLDIGHAKKNFAKSSGLTSRLTRQTRGGTGTVAWLPPVTGFTREAWPYIYLCVITTM